MQSITSLGLKLGHQIDNVAVNAIFVVWTGISNANVTYVRLWIESRITNTVFLSGVTDLSPDKSIISNSPPRPLRQTQKSFQLIKSLMLA